MKIKINKLTLLFFMILLAAEFTQASFIANETITIQSDNVAGNLYLVGAVINIPTKTQGDILAAGSLINITSGASGDIMVAGANIKIMESVQDIRALGNTITINSYVNGDLMAFGGNVKVENRTVITKEARIIAASVEFLGTSTGNLKIKGASVYFDGTAENNLTIESPDFRFGPNAKVMGDLKVISDSKREIANGTVSGIITLEKPVKKTFLEKLKSKASFTLMLLIGGLIFLWLFNRFAKSVADSIALNPLRNMGFGFGALMLIPITAVLMMITIVLLPLGLILIAFLALMIFLSLIIAGIILGKIIFKDRLPDYSQFILGIVIFEALTMFPMLGSFLNFAAIIFGTGSISYLTFTFLKNNRKMPLAKRKKKK